MLNGTAVTDLRPPLGCAKLALLTLPIGARDVGALRTLPALSYLSYKEKTGGVPAQKAAEFWKEYDEPGWQIALRASGFSFNALKLQPDGTWELHFDDPKLDDLSFLRGAPISRLMLRRTAVADLTPLRGMKLTGLWLGGTRVTDLSPLEGMAIEELEISELVSDLTVVRGMPLRHLRANFADKLTDLSPLSGIRTLESVALPPGAQGCEFLRDFPKLERLSFKWDTDRKQPAQTAVEFWAQQDAKKM